MNQIIIKTQQLRIGVRKGIKFPFKMMKFPQITLIMVKIKEQVGEKRCFKGTKMLKIYIKIN